MAKYLFISILPLATVAGQVTARLDNIPSGVGAAVTIKALATREMIAVLRCIVRSFSFL